MAKNRSYPGDQFLLPGLTGKQSGKPVVLKEITGVALNDTELDAEGNPVGTVIDTKNVYKLEVVENQGAAITTGDKIYINAGTDVLSNDPAGVFFGIAYSRDQTGALIAIGETETIDVILKGKGA